MKFKKVTSSMLTTLKLKNRIKVKHIVVKKLNIYTAYFTKWYSINKK